MLLILSLVQRDIASSPLNSGYFQSFRERCSEMPLYEFTFGLKLNQFVGFVYGSGQYFMVKRVDLRSDYAFRDSQLVYTIKLKSH